ncbi:MAG: acylphosphatase [Nitrospirae bacterium]|nr:acylphosphatase [Nitrospirota bacterium]
MSQHQPVRARIWVSGRVQGVGYRMFTRDEARRLGLLGGVRNLRDGRVEVEVEGERGAVDAFVESLRAGPPMARVIDLQVQWEPPVGRHVDFSVWH